MVLEATLGTSHVIIFLSWGVRNWCRSLSHWSFVTYATFRVQFQIPGFRFKEWECMMLGRRIDHRYKVICVINLTAFLSMFGVVDFYQVYNKITKLLHRMSWTTVSSSVPCRLYFMFHIHKNYTDGVYAESLFIQPALVFIPWLINKISSCRGESTNIGTAKDRNVALIVMWS